MGELTKWIWCEIGVKPGCVLSPMLFSLFIGDILQKVGKESG